MIYKLIQVANNSFLDLYMKCCTYLNERNVCMDICMVSTIVQKWKEEEEEEERRQKKLISIKNIFYSHTKCNLIPENIAPCQFRFR